MRARVLLAEDNEDHAFLTERALSEGEGDQVEVVRVHDGEEALEYLERRGRFIGRPGPHLILLDLKMPRLGGLEVLARVKADESLRSIPVVVLSSSDRPEDVAEAYRRGTSSYVTKPQGSSSLREGVRQLSRYWVDLVTLPEPAA